MDALAIPEKMLEEMIEQANEAAPVEACGILAGKENRVEKFYKMVNTDNSNTHFTMLPEEQFKVIKDIRSAGLKMLAIYHSHPETGARLSQEDVRLALTPDVIYVILSLANPGKPDIKAFEIEAGVVTATPVEIVKG